MCIGYCLVGYLSFPYSNLLVNKQEKKDTNKKFGQEFARCVQRVSQVVQDMLETQSTINTSVLLQETNEKDSIISDTAQDNTI